MPIIRRYAITILFVLFVFSSVFAQAQTTTTGLTITAAATGERVRITAPASIVQLHVEVYAPTGQKLLDQEIRGGNIFDWHLQDGQAQRLAPGSYVCVVTAKSISGKLTQKIGTVTVEEKTASVQTANSQQLSPLQAQAIGPVEENSSWTIPGSDEPQTPTVIANDGKDGQMIRGRGALTFRIGNFFSGIDTEQMRLTEEGNVGVGTSEPKARLDVAGTVRAERFLVTKPTKTTSGDPVPTTDAAEATQVLAAGAGTWNRLAKWMDDTGTLGDSVISESGGNIGIGTTTPEFDTHLQVQGTAPGAQIRSYSTSSTGTNYGIDSGATGIGSSSNVGGFFMASGAGTNKAIYISGVSAKEYNWALYSDAAAQSFFSGNVGIGTKYPARALHIKTASDQQLLLDNDGGTYTSLYFANNGLVKGNVYLNNPTNEFRVGGTGLDTATVFTANGDVERMKINGNGNVGIGVTSPGSRLTVAGTIETTSGGIKFPDGTTQTTAGVVSATYVQKAGDTMTGTLNVPAIKFPDGTTQSTAGVRRNGDTMTGQLRLPVNGLVVGDGSLVVSSTVTPSGSAVGIGIYPECCGNSKVYVRGNGEYIGIQSFGSTIAFSGTGEGPNGEGVWGNGEAIGVTGKSTNGIGVKAFTYTGIGTSVWSGTGNIIEGWSQYDVPTNAWSRKFFFAHDGTLNLPANGLVAGTNQLVLSGGGVGIGTNSPRTQLQVTSGDVFVETQGKGIILKATDGPGCFRVTVNNAGTLTATSVACP